MGKHGKFFRWASAFVLILTMFSSILTSASATENVCGPLDSGKIDTSGDPASVTIEAPDGYLIDGYCVKAGSAKQGYGPEYVSIEPVGSVTISHSSGKSVSHYSYSLVPIDTPSEPTLVTPLIPTVTPSGVCGVIGTATPVPMDGVLYGEVWYEGNTAFVIATPAEGFVFADGVTSLTLQADVTPDTECPPELIEVTPVAPAYEPSLACDAPGTVTEAATTGVIYTRTVSDDGNFVTITATADVGYTLVGQAVFGPFDISTTECPPEGSWSITAVTLICTPEGVTVTFTIDGSEFVSEAEGDVVDVQIRRDSGGIPVVSEFVKVAVGNPGPYSVDFESEDLSSGSFIAWVIKSGSGNSAFVKSELATCSEDTQPSPTPSPSPVATPSPSPSVTPTPSPAVPPVVVVTPDAPAAPTAPVASAQAVTNLPSTGSGPSDNSSSWLLLAGGAALLVLGSGAIRTRSKY